MKKLPPPQPKQTKNNVDFMRELINKIKVWLQKLDGRKVGVGVAIAALTLIVISVFNLLHAGYFRTSTTEMPSLTVKSAITSFRHPLTGVLVDHQIDPPVVYGVMVENSADAWPQSGIDKAFEVVEASAEGSIPRFLALFSSDTTVDKIGPVRSARPYYIDFASAFGLLYAHVGGSPDAIAMLNAASSKVLNFDEFYNQYQFWRSPDRVAPHNAYTSTDLLAKGLAKRYPDKAVVTYSTYTFKDDAALDTRPQTVNDTVVNMGVALYRVTWKYDRETNTYSRYENTGKHLTGDGTQLRANNIVVIATDERTLDAVGRLSIRMTGEGKAMFVQDGLVKNVTWKKPTVTDIMRFYDDQEIEVKMNAGQTWIEVVKDLTQVSA